MAALRVRDIIARTKEGVGSPKLGPGKGYVTPLQAALSRALTSPSKQPLQALAGLVKILSLSAIQVPSPRKERIVVSSLAKQSLYLIFIYLLFSP